VPRELYFPVLAYRFCTQGFISSAAVNGVYTELFAGLSPSITEKDNGRWGMYFVLSFVWVTDSDHCVPSCTIWLSCPSASRPVEEDMGREYWEWTENQVKQYLQTSAYAIHSSVQEDNELCCRCPTSQAIAHLCRLPVPYSQTHVVICNDTPTLAASLGSMADRQG
jgi:hypothetical protein